MQFLSCWFGIGREEFKIETLDGKQASHYHSYRSIRDGNRQMWRSIHHPRPNAKINWAIHARSWSSRKRPVRFKVHNVPFLQRRRQKNDLSDSNGFQKRFNNFLNLWWKSKSSKTNEWLLSFKVMQKSNDLEVLWGWLWLGVLLELWQLLVQRHRLKEAKRHNRYRGTVS